LQRFRRSLLLMGDTGSYRNVATVCFGSDPPAPDRESVRIPRYTLAGSPPAAVLVDRTDLGDPVSILRAADPSGGVEAVTFRLTVNGTGRAN